MKIRMKEIEPYKKTQDAKFLGNFYWDIELYLEQMSGISNEAKVNVVAMFLKGTPNFQWRNEAKSLVASLDLVNIENWVDMKQYFKSKFGLQDQPCITRSQLVSLRNMTNENHVFQCMEGPPTWAQSELKCQNMKTLAMAITASKKLFHFKIGVG